MHVMPFTTTEQVIENIKANPILYDEGHPDYKNTCKKDQIWEEIGAQMQSNGDTIKKKWKNIKDTYVKYLRSRKKPKEQRSKKDYAHWQYAKAMEAFNPFLSFAAKTKANRQDAIMGAENVIQFKMEFVETDEPEEILDDNANVATPPSSQIEGAQFPVATWPVESNREQKLRKVTPRPTRKRRIAKEVLDESAAPSPPGGASAADYLLNKRTTNQVDAVELIFLGYAKTVKSFSPIRQVMTKMKIAEIIMEQELQHLEEASVSLHTSTASNSSS